MGQELVIKLGDGTESTVVIPLATEHEVGIFQFVPAELDTSLIEWVVLAYNAIMQHTDYAVGCGCGPCSKMRDLCTRALKYATLDVQRNATGWCAVILVEGCDTVILRAPLQFKEFPRSVLLCELGDRVHADMIVRDWMAEGALKREQELERERFESDQRNNRYRRSYVYF